jgi:Flp pilus assembly protein TadD
MAEAARNVGGLLPQRVAAEPEHAETARLLGYALMLCGDLREAEAAFAQSLTAAIKAAQGVTRTPFRLITSPV